MAAFKFAGQLEIPTEGACGCDRQCRVSGAVIGGHGHPHNYTVLSSLLPLTRHTGSAYAGPGGLPSSVAGRLPLGRPLGNNRAHCQCVRCTATREGTVYGWHPAARFSRFPTLVLHSVH